MAKSTAKKKSEESEKNLKAKREGGMVRSSDANDPLLGWDVQQGARPTAEPSRLYKDDPVVYSKDQLPRNRPEIVPEDQRGDLDATVTRDDGGPQTANVDPKDAEKAEKEDAQAREEEENDEGDESKKTVTKKSSSKK